MVEPTHLEKYARQIGSFPQVGEKIKNIWVATTQIWYWTALLLHQKQTFEPKVLEVWFTSLKQRTCQVAMPPKKEFPIPVLLGSLLVLQKHGTTSIWQSDTNMLNSSWGTPLDFNIKPILNEILMINIPNKMQETISSGNPMFHPGTQHLTVIFNLMLWPYGTHHRFLKDQQDIEQRLLMALNRSGFYGERWRDTTWILIFGIKGFGHTIYVDSLINING